MTNTELMNHIDRVIVGLNTAEEKKYAQNGYTHTPDKWYTKARSKYIAINCGSSGAFLVDGNGELYNIKGYGCPDRNKKRKADLGNIATVDHEWLHTRRYNYLR